MKCLAWISLTRCSRLPARRSLEQNSGIRIWSISISTSGLTRFFVYSIQSITFDASLTGKECSQGCVSICRQAAALSSTSTHSGSSNGIIAEPPWVHPFGRNLLIIDVTALANHRSNWNIKVFEHVNHARYVLHEEDIVEVSFPLEKIMGALRNYFAHVRVVDTDCRRPTGKSERLFFICKEALSPREPSPHG